MIVIIFFDKYGKDIFTDGGNTILVHHTNIPDSLIPTVLLISDSKKKVKVDPKLEKAIERTSGVVIGFGFGYSYLLELYNNEHWTPLLPDGIVAIRANWLGFTNNIEAMQYVDNNIIF
jgi:hypothetical protein